MGGATITFAPLSGIPTLSEWVMILTILFMVVMGVRVLRVRNAGRLSAWFIGAAVFALASATGTSFLQRAHAVGPLLTPLTNPGGESLILGVGPNEVQNNSGVSQAVVGIALAPGTTSLPTVPFPQCVQGLVVPAAQSCFLNLQLLPPPP